jgi:hypothetical protein
MKAKILIQHLLSVISLQSFVILFLFLATPAIGQQSLRSTDFLATAYETSAVPFFQQKMDYQRSTDHSLPLLKDLEIRTEIESFEWLNQEYVLRAGINSRRQRKAQDQLHQSNIALNETEQQLELKEALSARYEWLLQWLELQQLLEDKKELQSLYEDRLTYVKRTVDDADFEVQSLVKAEENVLEMAYDILKIETRQRELKNKLKRFALNLDNVSIQQNDMVNNEAITRLMNIPTDSISHLALLKKQNQIELLAKEYEVELSEIKNPIGFAQVKMSNYQNGLPTEYISIGLSFRLPVKGNKVLDLNKIELERIGELGEYEMLKTEIANQQQALKEEVQLLLQRKAYLEEQQEKSQAKYVLGRLEAIPDSNPLDILELKEILLKRQQAIDAIDLDILTNYVEWLEVSDIMVEQPLRNHLLLVPEWIVRR